MTPVNKPGQKDVLDLIKLIKPWAMRGTSKIRLGNAYDGGYVVPATVLHCDAVVSIGVGPDVSFDFALAERGAKILQFDHTVEGTPQQHANFIFAKQGWGRITEGPFLSFDDILTRLRALAPKRALLKFDIEGGEYEVLESVTPEQLALFDVIACEVHDFERLNDPAFFAKVRRTFEKLTTHHAPVHLHANNYQSVVLVEGVPIPKVLELSFLRRDLDQFPTYSSDPIPGPLDRPNCPVVPDICMNPF
ncbi:FkbM family methyltransferase [Caldimonas brevitalea]|uniref:FkbM family methyltransferase n=1 Tax=Caldimonas brevitalea TaxID=413882 RepID=UPI0012F7E0C3|nr:FkbM family methyltransferase [Caldimonas brevitalea]